MIYKVLSAEPKTTSTGKPMKVLSLESEAGVQQVNIFSDFPHYADIIPGSTIDGEIRKNDKGYNNLYSSEIKPRSGAPGTFKAAQIEKVMDKKEASISQFQDNKELSIKMASTMRMAVDLAIAEYRDETVLDTLERSIEKWRAWCWKHWDDPITNPIYPE